MYNPFMGGFGNYNPGTGQWSQPPQPQMDPQMQEMQQRGNIQDRMGNLNSRITKLQEQYKGAGTEQQAGIQGRIDAMQGNVGRLQGKLDAGGGANRIGMDFRKERRQAKNAGTYDPTAQQGGGQQMNGMAQYFGQLPQGFGQQQGGYGMNPWAQQSGGMGMAGFGGWAGQQFGYNPGANFRPSDPNQINLMGPQQSGGQQMNGMAQYFGQLPPGFGQGPQGSYGVGGMGMGGGMPQYGGMNYGGGYGGWQSGGGMGGMGEMAYRGGMPQGMFPQPQYRTQEAGQNQGGATPVAPYNPQAAPQMGGGWNPAWGTPTDQFGNPTTAEAYNQRAKNFAANGIAGMMSPTDFQTPFGHLVPASGGNSNIYKQNGSDGSSLYHFDPTQGWKHMTADEYRGYGDYNYQSPLQSEDMARRAGAMSASNYW